MSSSSACSQPVDFKEVEKLVRTQIEKKEGEEPQKIPDSLKARAIKTSVLGDAMVRQLCTH